MSLENILSGIVALYISLKNSVQQIFSFFFFVLFNLNCMCENTQYSIKASVCE